MTRRQEAAAETRRRLLEAAGKLVAEHGFDSVSVDDIVKSTGVARGTFYIYFRNKADAVREYTRLPFYDLEAKILAMQAPVTERIAQYVRDFTGAIEAYSLGITQQWVRQVSNPNCSPEGTDNDKLSYDLTVLTHLLGQAVADGELREDTPVEQIVELITCQLYGEMTCWCMSSGRMKMSVVADAYCRQELPALFAPYLTTHAEKESKMIDIKLSNDVNVPSLGLGTFQMTPAQAEEAVLTALKDGYRLIDTANGYNNERAVGRGIAKSGVPRSEIFLATKLWPTVYEQGDAVDRTLERLGVDYVDLLFIHQPAGNYMAGYRQLEKAYRDGRARSIGISNFYGDKLATVLRESEIKPQVAQLEAHPYCIEKDTMALLAPYGTRLMAWYPLGHGDHKLLDEPVFGELAKKYGKTPAQIILRWHVQMGHIVIPGSTNPEHIASNIDIFDFALTPQDMEKIAALDTETKYYVPTPEQEESYASIELELEPEQ